MSARALIAVALCMAFAHSATAQRAQRIFDVTPGTHVAALPTQDFVAPACGAGGARGLALANFSEFARCAADAEGLRDIAFEYDDTAEFVALARREPLRRRTTALLDHPVVVSLLVDGQGYVQGFRVATDARAEPELRLHAHELALHFRARYGLDGHCTDAPPAPGETPVDGDFIKQACMKEHGGLRVATQARFYFRPGQQLRDPHTNLPMANAFESSARLEVRSIAPARVAPPAAIAPVVHADARAAFLAGATKDCPNCDLRGADLRYRDLAGADLAGADLDGAALHRAALRGANLRGAKLAGANLNRADLAFAQASGASLAGAMLYQAEAARADFSHADLSGVRSGKAVFTTATFTHARLDRADLAEARFAEAIFTDASLAGADLALALLARADMKGANLDGARLSEARLRDADLAGASLRNADLTRADLAGADLRGAVMEGARMEGVDVAGARR